MTDKKEKAVFSKEKILKMSKFQNRIDLLSVLLNDDKSYELKDVDKLISDFMKGALK